VHTEVPQLLLLGQLLDLVVDGLRHPHQVSQGDASDLVGRDVPEPQ
jgi:hypothetical protein